MSDEVGPELLCVGIHAVHEFYNLSGACKATETMDLLETELGQDRDPDIIWPMIASKIGHWVSTGLSPHDHTHRIFRWL